MQAFDSLLKDHQRALLPDGFSVLESAVIQHNIRSVAGMYDNITLDQLAALLGLSVSRVETLTCDMISEGRLKGHVDQVRDLPSASMNARARLTAGRDWGPDYKPMYSKMDARGPVKKENCQDRRFIVSPHIAHHGGIRGDPNQGFHLSTETILSCSSGQCCQWSPSRLQLCHSASCLACVWHHYVLGALCIQACTFR